jgi:hypothetical protein
MHLSALFTGLTLGVAFHGTSVAACYPGFWFTLFTMFAFMGYHLQNAERQRQLCQMDGFMFSGSLIGFTLWQWKYGFIYSPLTVSLMLFGVYLHVSFYDHAERVY